MGQTIVSFEIADAPPPRMDKALGRDVPAEASLSRSRLAKLIEAGAVQVDGAVRVGLQRLHLAHIGDDAGEVGPRRSAQRHLTRDAGEVVVIVFAHITFAPFGL